MILIDDETVKQGVGRKRSHPAVSSEIVIEEEEPVTPCVGGKLPRPADERRSGKSRKRSTSEASGGGPSKTPLDPLLPALCPRCMRQAPPTMLAPFANVKEIEDPGRILDHLSCCWNVPELSAGTCEAAFTAFVETVGTPERISACWREMQTLIANIQIDNFKKVEDTQEFVAWVVFATLGGAFHVTPSQGVDFPVLKQMGKDVPIVLLIMYFPTLFPGSPPTLLGLGDPAHRCFNGFKVNSPRADGYQPSDDHQVWELGKVMENGDSVGLDTPVLLGKHGEVLWIGWRAFNSRRFLGIFALFISYVVCGLYRAHDRIHHESIVDRYFTLQDHVRCGHGACMQADYHERTVRTIIKPLATLAGVTNVHGRNKASDGSSQFTWTTHFSAVTRRHVWQEMTSAVRRGTALLASLVHFAQSVGGPAQGKIVGRAMEALITGKKTGTLEIDIIVEYVKCCWSCGSTLGGLGGQDMWDFHNLCQFTQRAPQSFCTDPKFQAILARAKYQRGLGHDKSVDKDVGEDGSELDETTPAFVELFMKKVKCLEEYGSKTRFEPGKSACPEMQWEKGESACPEMQWEKGKSVYPEKQWQKGESGRKANQWVSPWGTGSFGVKGIQQTYGSLNVMTKAIGANQPGMSKAWRAAMKKAPPSAQHVCFRFKQRELVFYKEVDSGKN